MKTLFYAMLILFFVVCVGFTLLHAQAINKSAKAGQTKPLPPPDWPADKPAPQKISVPSSPAKDALYAAVHKKDQTDKQISDLSAQIASSQAQAMQRFQQLQAQQADAQRTVSEAEAALLKEMKLDPEKFALNRETMEATEKVSPPSTTAPAPAPAPRQ